MIFLIRHGQTEFNRDGRLQGRLDSALTDVGVEQARRMGRTLRELVEGPVAWSVTSSPLGRAIQTAEIIRKELALPPTIEIDERLTELSVGDLDGLNREEILARTPGTTLAPGWLYKVPGGEGEDRLRARLTDWLAELDDADETHRVVVSHGIAGRMLRHLYAGEPLDGPAPPQDTIFRLHAGQAERIELR